jgi:hypothetical protein
MRSVGVVRFGMSPDTALNIMKVARKYGDDSRTVRDLPLRVVYLLAAPSTLEPVREGVAAGEVAPTHAAIKKAIDVTPGTRR